MSETACRYRVVGGNVWRPGTVVETIRAGEREVVSRSPQTRFRFDEPGRFEAVPVKHAGQGVWSHHLNWIPDGWTGVTVALWYADRPTAQALVELLNKGRRS